MKARMFILSIVALGAMLLCSCGGRGDDSQAPPEDSEFDHVVIDEVEPKEVYVEQIEFGTPGRDRIEQYGQLGPTKQYIAGDGGDDLLWQTGGTITQDQSIQAGAGNDKVSQALYPGRLQGGSLLADGGDGNDLISQSGAKGGDNITATGGLGDDTIIQFGGAGDDSMRVDAGDGNDQVSIIGGEGDDNIVYDVSNGTHLVLIDGGIGHDTVTLNGGSQSYTVYDSNGQVIHSQGAAGTPIRVSNIESIVYR